MNVALSKVFGLRPGVALDEKLAAALANPASKCSVRFVKSRGNSAIFISGMWLETVGAEVAAGPWLADRADKLPEFPHIREWAGKL